ncbi:hypothetical protein K491DRAFT_313682 [Lophiostoma macrostomum CBS 122681]|uniref:Uncharacterized protein n=1 Tax=Lophiostoma macrostomum CBS 122681 TaxID=1314788 RepID=A0A6A6SHV8_9PLEO|nr:hypothetical protein K491DRAFT_313682 [Lophiostoma macrostomum CBS 122681]
MDRTHNRLLETLRRGYNKINQVQSQIDITKLQFGEYEWDWPDDVRDLKFSAQNLIDSGECELEEDLYEYASAECWQLVSALALQERLPREIRDMIYRNIYTSRLYCVDVTETSEAEGYKENYKPDYALLNPAFVGFDMAQEAAEIYYRHNNFRLADRELKRFLEKSFYQVGVRPADHIRKIWIVVAYGVLESVASYFPKTCEELPAQELVMYERTRGNLSHLAQLRNKDQLTI